MADEFREIAFAVREAHIKDTIDELHYRVEKLVYAFPPGRAMRTSPREPDREEYMDGRPMVGKIQYRQREDVALNVTMVVMPNDYSHLENGQQTIRDALHAIEILRRMIREAEARESTDQTITP